MKYLRIIIFIVLCVFASGCLDIEYRIEIKPDGKQNVTVRVGMPVNLSSWVSDTVRSLEAYGYKVTHEIEGDRCWIIGTQTIPKGMYLIPFPEKVAKEKPRVDYRYYNLWIVKKYFLKVQYMIDKNKFSDTFQGNEYYEDLMIPMRYVISTPGKIVQNNADKINANIMTWKYFIRPDEKIDISFVSYDVNYFAIVLLLGTVIFIIYWRNFKKTNRADSATREATGIFKYHSKDANGIDKDGIIEASDEEDAVNKLREQGLFVISLKRQLKK